MPVGVHSTVVVVAVVTTNLHHPRAKTTDVSLTATRATTTSGALARGCVVDKRVHVSCDEDRDESVIGTILRNLKPSHDAVQHYTSGAAASCSVGTQCTPHNWCPYVLRNSIKPMVQQHSATQSNSRHNTSSIVKSIVFPSVAAATRPVSSFRTRAGANDYTPWLSTSINYMGAQLAYRDIAVLTLILQCPV